MQQMESPQHETIQTDGKAESESQRKKGGKKYCDQKKAEGDAVTTKKKEEEGASQRSSASRGRNSSVSAGEQRRDDAGLQGSPQEKPTGSRRKRTARPQKILVERDGQTRKRQAQLELP